MNYSQWSYGFNLAWELDFWGRFRRAIEAANDKLDASVENYDDVLVTLIGDVANAYIQIRTLQQQITFARQTLVLQKESLEIATAKYKGGQTSKVDVEQGQSDVSATEALIEQQLIPLRQTMNRLCVLMGMAVEDLQARLGDEAIPIAPAEVVVGMPANLLRRRPDVRRAERLAAAQNAEIGVAIAALYPQISIGGGLGWEAEKFKDLFGGDAFQGVVGPSFNWAILNYGRLLSNIRSARRAISAVGSRLPKHSPQSRRRRGRRFGDVPASRKRAEDQLVSVKSQEDALKEAIAQYKGGLVDYNRVVVLQERLVERQQILADAQGQIALGLIQVYRASGGGWQIRTNPDAAATPVASAQPVAGGMPAAGMAAPATGMAK